MDGVLDSGASTPDTLHCPAPDPITVFITIFAIVTIFVFVIASVIVIIAVNQQQIHQLKQKNYW